MSLEQTKLALALKESDNGRNPRTYQLNNHNAFGKFQVTAGTFAGMQKNGDIPADWQHTNPKHADAAGEKLVEQLYKQYGGDLTKIAAAFYAGPKAVRGDKIVNYRDLKNPNNPDVLQYIQGVQKLAGDYTDINMEDDAEEADTKQVSLPAADLMNTPMPPRYDRQVFATGKAPKEGIATPAVEAPLVTTPSLNEIQAEAGTNEKRKKQIDDTSFLDVARASFSYGTMAGAAMRHAVDAVVEPEFKPDPLYKPDPEVFAGRTGEEQQELMEAVSAEHAQRIVAKQDDRREAEDVMSRRGLGMQLAAGFVAAAPEAIVTGLGTARGLYAVGKGSMQLAAQGRTAAALASMAVENVGAGLVVTAGQDYLDGHVSAKDYAIGALMDLSLGFLGAPLHIRASADAKAHSTHFSSEAMRGIAEIDAELEAARSRAGEGAPKQAVQAEAARAEAEMVQTVQESSTKVDPSRKLVSDEDNGAVFYGETKEAAPAQEASLLAPGKEDFKMDEYVPWSDSVIQRGAVEMAPTVTSNNVRAAFEAIADMRKLLPEGIKVRLGEIPKGSSTVQGASLSDNMTARIALMDAGSKERTIETAMHEVQHAIDAYYFPNASDDIKARLWADFDKYLTANYEGNGKAAQAMRFADKGRAEMGRAFPENFTPDDAYLNDFGEWMAEQAVRYFREDAAGANVTGFRQGLVDTFKKWMQQILKWFGKAKEAGYLPPTESFRDYIKQVQEGKIKPLETPVSPTKYSAQVDAANAGRAAVMNDPIARKYGIDLLPMGTPAEQARAKTILALYKRADAYPKPDEKRLKSLLKNTVFADNTGTLLRSENPIMRMLASELLESASGATKRQATAAIGKYIVERKMLGNSLQILEGHYKMWRNEHGGHIGKDLFDGKDWANFNKQVAIHIESKGTANSHPAVRAAAEELEKGYDRIRLEQVGAKTLGYKGLPETSVGYMPHKMSPEALRNLSVEQARVLHSALTDQFISIEGFDPTFADRLASKYLDVVRRRGVGGYHGSIGDGAADLSVMEDALDSLNLTKQESDAMKQRMRSGSAGYTKGRLKLDLLREHALADGSTFRLIDVFETDQRALLRQQAGRASGEVALARHGILGKPGLQLMREAAELGDAGSKAQPKEFEAFDQVSAEFLNEPFGNHNNRLLDRVMQANSLARLGGMFFPQLGEFTNGVAHLGMAHAFAAVPGLRRLRAEAKALARGEKVDNPILGSIETVSGAEFGTDTYKFSFPFQEPDKVYQTYGQDSLTSVDRLLRGGLHVQAKLSFWRSLHAAQQRGMAEQIVRKSLRYMRDGVEDVALSDMGFTKELRDKLAADLPNIATWGSDGNLESLDLTKAQDLTAVEDYIQAVHRGTNQIIQGTFIGEQGKWAHDGLLRFLTQFRTFSITSVEKQWTRQMNNHGAVKGWGIMLGTMMMAAPIYIARTFLNSVGRDDQQEYLDKMLTPAMIARASMNYVAMTGLAGDFADAFTAVTGTGEVTGARSGASTGFVGTVVAPGAGWVDDVWKGLQNTEDGTDPSELAKTLPFANLPLLSVPVRMLAP